MRKLYILIFAVMLLGAGTARPADPPQEENTDSRLPATKPADANSPVNPESAAPAARPEQQPPPAPTESAPAQPAPLTTGDGRLILNFHGVSLDMVLKYLSDAAGFIINVRPGVSTRGKVELYSGQPLTKEEALEALDTVLNENELAAVRKGRVLTIVNRDEAKTQDIPVISESRPDKIPQTDQIVTQIIPVQFVEVAQLVKDLQPLVSLRTTLTANESGNSIVITDTQSSIHRVAEIVHAIDMGAEDMTLVRVFKLRNADASEMADLLSNLFPDESKSGNNQSPIQFRGFGGRFGGIFGGGGPSGQASSSSGNQNQRIKKRARVIAVADQRTASVTVTAAKDLMEQIDGVIQELDSDPANIRTVSVMPIEHADPQEVLQVLQDMFQKSGTQSSSSRNAASQQSVLNNRSTTQNQQNNSSTRQMGTGVGNNRGGLGSGTPQF